MNKLKTQFLSLIILSSFSLQLFQEEKSFNFNEDHLELSKEIVRILETEHYSKKEFSSIKRESFNLFLERLDPNKIIFLDREIKNYLDAVENNSSDELENSLLNVSASLISQVLNNAFQIILSLVEMRGGWDKKLSS